MTFQFKNIQTGHTFNCEGFDSAKKAAEHLKREDKINDFLVNIFENFEIFEENQLITDIFILKN